MKSERILILINSRAELFELSESLKIFKGNSLLLVFTRFEPESSLIIRINNDLPNAQIKYFNKPDESVLLERKSNYSVAAIQSNETVLKTNPGYIITSIKAILRSFVECYRIQSDLSKTRKILKSFRPQLVFSADSSPDYHVRYFFKYQGKYKFEVITFPYTFANWKEYYESFKVRPSHLWNNIICSYVKFFDPAYFINSGNKFCMRVPSGSYIPLKAFGLLGAMNNPWTMNSLAEKNIIVESDFMKDYFVKAGLSSKAISVLGSVHLDTLKIICNKKEATRQKLISEGHFFDPEKKTLLCCPPPLQPDRTLFGFANYVEYLNFIKIQLEKLSLEYNIVFKFHPRMHENEIKELEKLLGIQTSKLTTPELLSLSDLYVTSISATIRWALALGIPVINHDVYLYDYNDFENSPNVHTLNSKEELINFLNKLSGEGINWIETEKREYWGVIDGNRAIEIKKFCDNLIFQTPPS